MRTQPLHQFDTHVEAVIRPFLIAFVAIFVVMVLSLGFSSNSFAQDVSKDLPLKTVKEIPVPELTKTEETPVDTAEKTKEGTIKVASTEKTGNAETVENTESVNSSKNIKTAEIPAPKLKPMKAEPTAKVTTEALAPTELSMEDETEDRPQSVLRLDSAIVDTVTQSQTSMIEQSDAVETPTENLFVTANKGVLLRLKKPISDIFLADPTVADVQVKSPRIVYVFGKKTGQTSLFAMNEKDDVVFSANLTVEQDIAEVQNAIDMLLPTTNIRVKGINGMIILDGYVDSPEDAAMAERMVKAIVKDGPQLMSRLIISTPTQINLRVKIAEVNRDIMKELGVNWENALSGDNILFGVATGTDPVSYITDPVTGIVEKVFNVRNSGTNSLVGNFRTGNLDLNTVVDALEGEGYLSVLAEPNLTAISGKAANFLAGGEFPVPVPDQGEIGIEYKQFGVGLNFTPTVLSDRKINLEVAPEVSQLSSAGAIRMNGISVPSISTRRVSTTVELGSGQSFAIAGLIQNNITGDTSKVPGLGDIPILGALFRSERFRKQETELVVIVTPYIVRPMDERQIVLPTDGQVIPTDYQRYLSGKGLSQEARPQTLSKGKKGRASLGQAGFRIGQR